MTPFRLQNDAARPPKWRGRQTPDERQLVLLDGLDCLPGQQDLFPAQDAARTAPAEGQQIQESAETR